MIEHIGHMDMSPASNNDEAFYNLSRGLAPVLGKHMHGCYEEIFYIKPQLLGDHAPPKTQCPEGRP